MFGHGESRERKGRERTLRCRLGSVFDGAEEEDEKLVVVGGGVGARDGLVMIVPWPLAA
jgi:hypothetical protein